ncbi:MAG: biotin/lipoyl-binding protein, partial [Candidatus Eremiobacteraeota bacterium]|nr:biotin/lipoyl-binding protein [Candidatus Eremiobacteraeota bacterium]
MRPALRLTLVAVAALIVAVVIWRVSARPPTQAPQDRGPQVPLALVHEGTVEATIALVGRVGSPAGTQTKLGFPLSGSVQRVDVSLGERVEAGAALAHLDATPYALAAQQAQAEASAARAASAAASVDR